MSKPYRILSATVSCPDCFGAYALLISDENLEIVSSIDHVITSNDCDWLCFGSFADAIGNRLGDKFKG